MSRIQKDAIYVPVGVNSTIKWVPADGNRHPNGLLEVTGCDIGRHAIARYKSSDNFWSVRPSKYGDESFIGEELTFLLVKAHRVYWEDVQNDKLPRDKYFVSDKSDGEPQKCIGKHKTVGVGHVMPDPETNKLKLYSEKGNQDADFQILCVRRSK